MKKTINFIFDHEYEDKWKDGLYGALMHMSYDYKINFNNLRTRVPTQAEISDCDFILGWGAFNSSADRFIQSLNTPLPKGLCIAGVAAPPVGMDRYNVLFYETDWYKPQIQTHPHKIKAFGINSKIYRPAKRRKVWDWMTVGAFSTWKRQEKLLNKDGTKLAIGEIQRGNPQESLRIVAKLLAGGAMVSDMVAPEVLAEFYQMSERVYIPADIFGGGERAVLEARSCGIPVVVESDNPKLLELTKGDLPNEIDYANQLIKGVESCL